MYKKYTFLSDLNKLSDGLADNILSLIESLNVNPLPDNWIWKLPRTQEEVKKILKKENLSNDDIIIDSGSAKGLTIRTAFEVASNNYILQAQLNTLLRK